MADVNHIITLGIGTPADIPHFVLVGLSPNTFAVDSYVVTEDVRAVAAGAVSVAGYTGAVGVAAVYEPIVTAAAVVE